jgi:hypothetical protein
MAVTVLSGTSGALYYKPAGTTGTFGPSNVTIGTETIVVQTYLNLKVMIQLSFKLLILLQEDQGQELYLLD